MTTERKPDQIREQPMTYDDFAALPDDENRYELVAGELELISPSEAPAHQFISFRLMSKMMQTCENDYIMLHDIDVVLSKYEVRRPDIVMIRRDRMSIVTRKNIKGPPDLVVEILSPSSIRRDKVGKLQSYAYYSINEYWIVDPANAALEQYQLTDGAYKLINVYSGDELVQSDKLPCISFTMNDIMAGLPDFADDDEE